jgi:hypothetical protein
MKTNKKCSKCNEIKPISEFRKNGDWWMGKCKPCQYTYTSEKNPIYKNNNKEKYKGYQKKANKKGYDRGQTFINKHRALCGCQKCGEKRYWVIDYHHIDPKQKDHPITYYKTSTLEVLKRELKKCVPLCRNCHTDFHHLEKKTNITIKNYLEKHSKK